MLVVIVVVVVVSVAIVTVMVAGAVAGMARASLTTSGDGQPGNGQGESQCDRPTHTHSPHGDRTADRATGSTAHARAAAWPAFSTNRAFVIVVAPTTGGQLLMRLHLTIATGLMACLAALFATPAAAGPCGSTPRYRVNYQFSQAFAVTGIAKYNEYGTCGSGISNSDAAPVGPSLLTDIFPKTDPVTRALLLGVATDLPGDPEGQRHLVLFTNDLFAVRAQHIAFGTLFPGVDEGSLIDALLSLATGNGTDADYDLLFGFAGGGALGGPNGDAGFGLGDSFTSVAFSDGQIVGTGRFFATAVVSDVPEPATWTMLIVGFGAVGATARRRRARLAKA